MPLRSLAGRPKGPSRGQLSIFIVVSVFIVILLGLLYFRVVRTEKRVSEFTKTSQQWDVDSIRGAVQACVNKVSTDAVFYFGMVGGRTDYFKSFYVYDDLYKIPFYFRFGAGMMPSNEHVEKDIMSIYITEHVPQCVRPTISHITGFRITEGQVASITKINEKTVDVKVEYPLTITKLDQSTTIKDFSFSLQSRLFDMLRITREIVDLEKQDQSVVHWDYLSDVTSLGYNITAHAEEGQTIVYRIVDPQSKIFFEPFIFQFANQVKVMDR